MVSPFPGTKREEHFMSNRAYLGGILLCVVAICRAEEASQAPASPTAAAVSTPQPIKLGPITLQGSFRSRFEEWNWFQGDTGENSYGYSGSLLRLSLAQSFESVDWQLEFAVPILLGLPDNSVAAGTQGQLGLGATYYVANDKSRNAALPFAKQGFVRFHRNHNSLRLGRFEFLDGSEATPQNATLAALKRDRINQRLIGNFGWAHVGRSLDGLQYLYSAPSGTFTFVGARPTRGVFQTDGWGETNTALGYAAYSKPWGKSTHASETRLLAIYYDDWRPILKTDNRPLAPRRADLQNIRIFTFGGHHLSALTTAAGTLDLLAWGVGQTGNWGQLEHRAYAVDFEAGLQPPILKKLKPWLRGGYTLGSGDSNPNDHTHGTFFQILPTPRPFARFPFFDMQNTRDIMASLILRPHKKVTTSSEFHALALADANDLWYSGGGVYNPWTFGYTGRATGGAKSLANLYDTSVEYRMRANVTLTAYTGYAQGLAATRAIYPKGKDGALGYLELNYKF
jgi:hypothetical protein